MPAHYKCGAIKAGKIPRIYTADPQPKWRVEPVTLNDLLERCGPHSDSARAFVEWSAVTLWLMNGSADNALASHFISVSSASLSVFLIRQVVEADKGWPRLPGHPVHLALYDLQDDAQQIARSIAHDVFDLWESAGRPNLDQRRIKDAYRWLAACIRAGSAQPVPALGAVPIKPKEI